MKKVSKKIVALLTAVIMLVTMAMPAMAATNTTDVDPVNVIIKWDGETIYNENIPLSYIQGLIPEGQSHIYTVQEGVTNQGNGLTVADALLAMEAYIGSGITEDVVTYGWDYLDYVTGEIKDDAGLYFNTYEGMGTVGDYYYYGQNDAGESLYYWKGSSWSLYVNDTTKLADKYASSYLLSDTTTIVFDYAESQTDPFVM